MLGPVLQATVFVLIFAILHALGIKLPYAKLGAFIGLCSLTGCFHEDGLADSFDSLGVPIWGNLEEARAKSLAAMRDSRLGSFGVSSLILLWLLRAGACMSNDCSWLGVTSVVLASRATSLYLGKVFLDRLGGTGISKSSFSLKEIPSWVAILSFLASMFLAFMLVVSGLGVFWGLGVALGAAFFSFCFLWLLSCRLAGVNGDMMGGAACFCESCLLFLLVGFS